MSPYYIPDQSQNNVSDDYLKPAAIQPVQTKSIQPPDQMQNMPMNTGVQTGQSENNASGMSGGDYTKLATGTASLIANDFAMSRQNAPVVKNTPGVQFSGNGQPSYDGSRYIANSGLRARGAGAGDILGGAASGASAGSAAGPYGAIIGAVVGAGASAIAGGSRKRRQQRQINQAKAIDAGYQNQYNTANQNYYSNVNAQLDYARRQNNYNNFNNLYSAPSGY